MFYMGNSSKKEPVKSVKVMNSQSSNLIITQVPDCTDQQFRMSLGKYTTLHLHRFFGKKTSDKKMSDAFVLF